MRDGPDIEHEPHLKRRHENDYEIAQHEGLQKQQE